MQIIVPAAGRGSRFAAQGYSQPKPVIEIMGKPLIKWSTDGMKGLEDVHYIFLVLQEHIEEHEIDKKLQKLYPECTIVPVKGVTEGAASTVLLAKEHLNQEESTFIVNCDNFFFLDVPRMMSFLQPDTAALILYIAANHPHWSYVQVGANGDALRVAEKEVISDKAIVGCHYFSKAKYFIEAAEYMIANNIRTRGEFYISPVFNILIDQGKRVQTLPCDLHFSLGTPEEAQVFETLFSTTPGNCIDHHVVD